MEIDYNKLYINIQGRMIHELNLKLNEATLYAIIFGFSQNGQAKFRGSLSYIENMLKLSRHTVIKLLNKLIEKNLIIKEENKTGNLYYVNMEIVQKMHYENEGSAKTAPEVVQKCTRGSAKTAHNNNKYNNNNKNNNITINSNTENFVFGENGKENFKNLEEEKVDKKNILDKPLLKNDSLLKKLEEEKKEKKVPQKKEKKEYGNKEVNKIIEIIKQNNDGIIAGTEKEKRQYTWLLFNKLKKYVNGKYDIFTTLDILLKKMKVSKYYATRITGPKKIYYKFEDMISVVKTEKNSKIRKF